jgi:hypothetical protein
MNGKQLRTLVAVFKEPAAADIDWAAIESLLVAAGCRVIEGSGSRVRFERDGIVASFHRPHADKEAKRYSGNLMIRVAPETHASAVLAAQLAGKSLSQWGEEALGRQAERDSAMA